MNIRTQFGTMPETLESITGRSLDDWLETPRALGRAGAARRRRRRCFARPSPRRPRVSALGFAAADVAARRAQADVEAAAALLALIRLGRGHRCGEVFAWLSRAEHVLEDLHAPHHAPAEGRADVRPLTAASTVLVGS